MIDNNINDGIIIDNILEENEEDEVEMLTLDGYCLRSIEEDVTAQEE